MTTAPATAATVESKSDKFKRLAIARMTKALDGIAGLRGLAAKANYEYTDAQVNEIEAALKTEVDILMKHFRAPASVPSTGFVFKT